jgi:Co/Zn/Cd efflux system component
MAGCCHHDHCETARADGTYRRMLWAALAINAVMFGVEGTAGILSGSVALKADALDFLGDAANYGISLYAVGQAVHWRSRAALAKAAGMALIGLWVLGEALYRVFVTGVPSAFTMGVIGFLALLANLGCATLLFRFRRGDADMRSVWLCSRNDVAGNLAVLLAASGVFATGTAWPDLLVAALMATLYLTATAQVVRHALAESREHRPVPVSSRA